MIAKTFEIRDRATFIPVLAVKLRPGAEPDRYLLARAGYGRFASGQGEYVMLVRLAGGGEGAHSDPYEWGSAARTMPVAHGHIVAHFDDLPTGSVVDVEFLLGEAAAPKKSEALEEPL